MPQRIPVKPLSALPLQVICQDLEKFLDQHNSIDCKYCKNEYLNENCHYLKQRKEMMENCSDTVKHQIYSKLISNLNSDENKKWEAKEHFDRMYFQIWLCQCSSLQTEYESSENMEDYHIAKNLGKSISSIRYINRCSEYLDLSCFSTVLSYAPNLRLLDFDITVWINDKILEVIGKNCFRICEIRGQGRSPERDRSGFIYREGLTVSGFQKLIFKDFETQSQNPCSETLQIIEVEYVDFGGGSYEDYDERYLSLSFEIGSSFMKFIYHVSEDRKQKLFSMLNKNLPNLKTFGIHFPIDEMIQNFESGMKIDAAALRTLQEIDVAKIQHLFPKLEMLHFAIKPKTTQAMLKLLNKIVSLKTLKLYLYDYADSLIYNGLLFEEWATLTNLIIEDQSLRGFPSWQELDISVIAGTLPNLEDLTVSRVQSVTWNRGSNLGRSRFNTLRNISITISGAVDGSYDWFDSFSATIKTVQLRHDNYDIYPEGAVLSAEATSTILNNTYPVLEQMNVYGMTYNADLVRDFTTRCSNLRCLNNFWSTEQQDINDLNEFFKKNNIDCTVFVYVELQG